MKRFSRLEFGDRDDKAPKASEGEQIRNEEFFYKQALRSWLAGDFELALRNYSRALEKNSSFFQAWLGQVLMLIELGEYNEAMVWADKAMELFPEHPELLAVKAIACVRDGRIEKAIAYSDNSIAKDNITARVWLARAEVLLERKSRIAENCISKAISICGDDSPTISLEAGRLLNKKENYSAALEYLRKAVDLLPKSPMAWYELGCCQAKLGRPEAEVTLQQCLKLRPKWELATFKLNQFKKRGLFKRLFGG